MAAGASPPPGRKVSPVLPLLAGEAPGLAALPAHPEPRGLGLAAGSRTWRAGPVGPGRLLPGERSARGGSRPPAPAASSAAEGKPRPSACGERLRCGGKVPGRRAGSRGHPTAPESGLRPPAPFRSPRVPPRARPRLAGRRWRIPSASAAGGGSGSPLASAWPWYGHPTRVPCLKSEPAPTQLHKT